MAQLENHSFRNKLWTDLGSDCVSVAFTCMMLILPEFEFFSPSIKWVIVSKKRVIVSDIYFYIYVYIHTYINTYI